MPELRTLEELNERGVELRSELIRYRTEDELSTDSPEFRSLLKEVDTLDGEFTLALMQQRQEQMRTGPLAGTLETPGGGAVEWRSVGEIVVADEHFKRWMEHGAQGVSPQVEIRATVDEWGTGGPPGAVSTGPQGINYLLPVGQPIAPVPRRARLFMRDLLTVQPTGLSAIPYVRELNPVSLEGGASATAETVAKPDISVLFEGDVAPITVLAANATLTRQVFEDAQTVVGYVNARLPYLVMLREDAEIINGNGTWPNLKGIRQFSGLQTDAGLSAETAISISHGIAKVELVDGTATAVVMYPSDAWAMFTKRAAGGSGTFDAGTPFSDIPMTVWGLPVLRSRVYPSGKALVGDFARGATLFDRQQVNVQVYPQHSDYPVKNQVLVQAEERVGLAVHRPDFFCDVTLPA